jgi:4a-hydroxytetrahydrobiopterin dehydratase
MVDMAPLSDDDVRKALEGLPDWQRDADHIVRDYELPTFPAVIELVQAVADLAEAANHHPDLDIRYNRLHVALTTHDQGGITQRDIDLAQEIETTASRWG